MSRLLACKEPIVYIVSNEESRIETAVQHWCDQADPPMQFHRWSCTRGLERLHSGVLEHVQVETAEADQRTAVHAPLLPILRHIVDRASDDSVFLLKDVHHYLRDGTGFSPSLTLTARSLRDAFQELRSLRKRIKIVLLSPEPAVPADLEKEVQVRDFPLPTREEHAQLIARVLQMAKAIKAKDPSFNYEVPDEARFLERMAGAALGLTLVEVEYVLENMLYLDRRLDEESPMVMMTEKRQIIRKSGVLEFIPPEDLADLRVGGLENMLHWLKLRHYVLENAEMARSTYGIRQMPKGVLLMGIPGCGKSLTCKRIAQDWGLPLLRLDVGAVFDRYVGASEERIRRALTVAESVAPCILWIDEIEKGFNTGVGGDGGTSTRVLGTFLVWMQEKRAPVFVAATANDITKLPPELLRAGRFDNRFFVGCPGTEARKEILRIHLENHQLPQEQFQLDAMSQETLGYTGAEIEQAVVDSVYDAMFENRRANVDDLRRNFARNSPMVKSMGPQLGRIQRMLEQGRMEMASNDTADVRSLIEHYEVDESQ